MNLLSPNISKRLNTCKIAIVHDELYGYAGAEKVLECILEIFPASDIFCLFDVVPEDKRAFLGGRKTNTTFIQKLPFLMNLRRYYFPLMPIAIEQLNLCSYDIVISSSYLVSKGVVLGPDQCHVCYLHSPMRYVWDMQHEYLDDFGHRKSPGSFFKRIFFHYLRFWDAKSSDGVDVLLSNSHFVARRARRAYRRESAVIYPPVDISWFHPGPPLPDRGDYYVTLGRLVPYKRFDLVIQAFNHMPERRLIIIGDGPERNHLKRLASSNVQLVGYLPSDEVERLVQNAKAFMFAATEDFGIAPVEAMACGTPVIGYGRGGLVETVCTLESGRAPTGLLFDETKPEAIVAAVEEYEANLHRYSASACHDFAQLFSRDRFKASFKDAVETAYAKSHLEREKVASGGHFMRQLMRQSA